jgi:outer membrane receptor for ferric coprogen and ferric-rhodotorulic acid
MRVRGDDDAPARTFVPRDTGRLNVSYAPPMLPALKLGASVQYQSRIYLEPGNRSTTTGAPVRITQDGYMLIGLLASYRLTDHVAVSANVKNLTDAKYLGALNFDQGFYGAPRSILGTVTVRY